MKNLTYLFGFLVFLSNCDRERDNENEYPTCLDSKIEVIKNGATKTPSVTLKKYNYKNKTVYVFFNLRYPDGADLEVYDENCKLICSQGVTINGTSFDTCIDWNDATYVSTIWTDPR